MAKTAVDPAFLKLVPKGSTCFLIWRIEDFSPQPLPRDQYGTFYDGDAYIVLAALEQGKNSIPDIQKALEQGTSGGPKTKVKEVRSSKLDIRIHFWLGKDSSQDEQGTAAIKTVELDDYMGGSPIQYREVQGIESKTFQRYFKEGLKVLKGGVKSGFNHVDMTHKNRLYSIKGKGTPRVIEIDIGWSNMNEGDVFMLDLGEIIFVWNGQSSNRAEKMKAAQYAQRLRSDRGQVTITIVEQGEEDDLSAEERELFEEHLPLSQKGQVKSAEAGGSDDAYERKAAKELKLWKVAEEGKALKITEIAHGLLKREMLDTNDCFIVDNGPAGLYVWVGRKASKTEKDESMNNANAFVKQRGLSNVRVMRVVEEGEPPEFKTLFKTWEKPLLPGQMRPTHNKIARTVQTKFDASTLHNNPQLARETGMVDDGSGDKTVYRMIRKSNDQYDKEEVKKPDVLFGGDCYIIHYSYKVNGKQKDILYYWLGRHSTQDERGVAALLTVRMDDEMSGMAEQIRVVHGKEPAHFLAIFNGQLIIYDGGRVGQATEEAPQDTYLIQVRGTSQLNCKAEQVPLTAESLNSNDCFVLFIKGGAVYIWAGKGSTGDEREMAKNIAKRSPKAHTLVCEGQEKDDFWDYLGGKKEYSTSPRLAQSDDSSHHPPRLFQGSNATGTFKVDEIVDFNQDDLIPEDVFILDAFHTLFVWIGDEANDTEKKSAFDFSIEYLETDPSGRDPDIPIKQVKQGRENTEFIGYFGVWDWERWSGFKSYAEMKRELGEQNLSMEAVKKKSHNGEMSFSDIAKYPYETLINREGLPEGLDLLHKEKHLTNEEFEKVFNMTYANFVKQVGWKQKQLKEKAKLF